MTYDCIRDTRTALKGPTLDTPSLKFYVDFQEEDNTSNK